jgi:ferrous iron transport protein A
MWRKRHGGAGSLAQLTPGTTGLIRQLADQCEPRTARRLQELGFVPGVQVTTLRRAPLGDPSVYRVAGYEISLRRSEASLIHLEATGEATA